MIKKMEEKEKDFFLMNWLGEIFFLLLSIVLMPILIVIYFFGKILSYGIFKGFFKALLNHDKNIVKNNLKKKGD